MAEPNGGATTEERIRQAATELFYERGFHGTTMREIAVAVGIKAGSLYNHYAGKEDILFRIVSDTTRDFLEGASAAIAGQTTPEAKLRALLEWHILFHAERRLEAKVADNELRSLVGEQREAVVHLRDRYESMLRGVLREGESSSGWSISDLSLVSIGIETMCTEVAMWFRDSGRFSAEKVARVYLEFILGGLRASST